MDNSSNNKKIILTRQKVNADGSVTTTTKLKRRLKKKVVVAQGRGAHTVGAVITDELRPFRKAMTRQLNSRGYNASRMPFKNVIPLYYNEFVSNTNNTASPFTPINSYEFSNHFAYSLNRKKRTNGDIRDVRNAASMNNFTGVVDNIVSIFQYSRLKKRQAILDGVNPKDVMTTEELQQAAAADKVVADLEDKALMNKPVTKQLVKNVLLIGLVVFLFYYLMK